MQWKSTSLGTECQQQKDQAYRVQHQQTEEDCEMYPGMQACLVSHFNKFTVVEVCQLKAVEVSLNTVASETVQNIFN